LLRTFLPLKKGQLLEFQALAHFARGALKELMCLFGTSENVHLLNETARCRSHSDATVLVLLVLPSATAS
jgi:hypothetical protein